MNAVDVCAGVLLLAVLYHRRHLARVSQLKEFARAVEDLRVREKMPFI